MIEIIEGDCLASMRLMPSASVHCCITSPPYWGLRDYGVDGQLGLEPTPEEYVAKMVDVFREVRRVLRDDGTLWLNLGDSYNANTGSGFNAHAVTRPHLSGDGVGQKRIDEKSRNTKMRQPAGLKPKDLVGIPWSVAFALRADGWWLRQEIIWHKPSPMPESVTDRCTKAHEQVFLLAKAPRYYFDADAIREPHISDGRGGFSNKATLKSVRLGASHAPSLVDSEVNPAGRNRRSVWTIASQPFPEAHFATFPPKLVEPMVMAGTSEEGCCRACGAPWRRVTDKKPMVLERSERTHSKGRTRASGTMVSAPECRTVGWEPSCDCNAGEAIPCTVLDPFNGAGTTGVVCQRLGRSYIGCELNPEYAAMARRRIGKERAKTALLD